MDKEKGAVEEVTTSGSSNIVAQDQGNNKQKQVQGEDVAADKVPFHKLFSFADATDRALMLIGSVGAIGNGVCMPLMAILFGEVIDAFGENQNTRHVIHVISQVLQPTAE